MTRVLYFLLLLSLLVSCHKADSPPAGKEGNGIAGKWKLTEGLADPGDGSGTWQPVNLPLTYYLVFNADGKGTYDQAGVPLGGSSYSVETDSTLIMYRSGDSVRVAYQLDANLLTITGGCFEPCGVRFARAD